MNNQKEPEGAVFRRYLTPPEQQKLLSTIRKHAGEIARRDHAVCQLLITSGMRIGETLKITTGAAADALQCDYLFIPREHRKGEACDLSVYLTRSIRSALYDLLVLREGAGVDEPLIVSRNRTGKAMTVRGFELRVAYWARLAGLPEGVSPHWFRHTHAKNIIRSSQAADPMRVAQAALGQRSRRSTEIYTSLDREELEASLKNVDSAVNGKPRVRLAHLRKQYERRVGA